MIVQSEIEILHLMERKDLESLHTKVLIKMLRYETKHYAGDYDTCEQIYDNGYNMLQFRLTEYGGYTREDVQKEIQLPFNGVDEITRMIERLNFTVNMPRAPQFGFRR